MRGTGSTRPLEVALPSRVDRSPRRHGFHQVPPGYHPTRIKLVALRNLPVPNTELEGQQMRHRTVRTDRRPDDARDDWYGRPDRTPIAPPAADECIFEGSCLGGLGARLLLRGHDGPSGSSWTAPAPWRFHSTTGERGQKQDPYYKSHGFRRTPRSSYAQ